jgi:hypothetical protein
LGYRSNNNKLNYGNAFEPVAIFNHLDIKVLVHPTLKSNMVGMKGPAKTIKIPNPLGGAMIPVTMPEQEVRIVGFEVTPYSIPQPFACEGDDFLSKKHDAYEQLVFPEQPIQFSYTLTMEHSTDTWPNRLDHYINFGKRKFFWEQLLFSITVLGLATILFVAVISSALERDTDMLKLMREAYRRSRLNVNRSQPNQNGPDYQQVNG